MITRHCFLVALGGLLILVLTVNFYFIRVIVESSSLKSDHHLPGIKSKSSNNGSITYKKFKDIQPINSKEMETKIQVEMKMLPPKYFKRNVSSITILSELLNELKTNNVVQHNIWSLPNDQWPNEKYLIPPTAPELGEVLNAMRKTKIIKADNAALGTQLKLLLTFENGVKILFKPQWYSRETVIQGPVYRGKDRHNAEVVAFHLSSLLALRRVPIAAIRTLNLKNEVRRRATPKLLGTMYQDGNNTCLYGVCHYCSIDDPVCGKGDFLEGTIILWLPSNLKLIKHRHPWQRMYKKNKYALWEIDANYCDKVKQSTLYSLEFSHRLLNLIDAAIFDFLMGNGDRHHYESFEFDFKNAAVLLIDNGKSLGNPDVDHYDILAPLYQCCMIHKSTWDRLKLLSGGFLSHSLGKLLEHEAGAANVHPLITNDHLNAMDRRLLVIYAVVEMCIKEKKYASEVIVDH